MTNFNRILVFGLLLSALFYTRFVGLNWGLPYPFHPDERNMAVALQQLTCNELRVTGLKNCLNPHFFAYGQFPLYLGRFLHFGHQATFESAILSLRFISAVSSVLTVFLALKILEFTNSIKISNFKFQIFALLFIFSSALIQFAHFGTTESLLMFFYALIIYLSLLVLEDKTFSVKRLMLISLACGLAIATKTSALIFLIVPLSVLIYKKDLRGILKLFVLTGLFAVLFSPHNLISYSEFLSAIRYESNVALGNVKVFYTRQFEGTTPIVFQFVKIFPYTLGWPTLMLFVLGFLFLPFKKEYNLLRISFLVYFLPNAFVFAKWTRFMAPIFPLMLIFVALFLQRLYKKGLSTIKNLESSFKILYSIFYILILIPGITYLSIYQNPDVRFKASEWIYKNIPENSYVLSETANVVDIPVPAHNKKNVMRSYNIVSFDLYNLDENRFLQEELANHLEKADYVFVPSRRVFANHPKKKYPILNKYYEDLFSGKLGFKKVSEFNSYPSFQISNFKFQIPDEVGEETWTVFDHPVVRIYKKI